MRSRLYVVRQYETVGVISGGHESVMSHRAFERNVPRTEREEKGLSFTMRPEKQSGYAGLTHWTLVTASSASVTCSEPCLLHRSALCHCHRGVYLHPALGQPGEALHGPPLWKYMLLLVCFPSGFHVSAAPQESSRSKPSSGGSQPSCGHGEPGAP